MNTFSQFLDGLMAILWDIRFRKSTMCLLLTLDGSVLCGPEEE